MQHCGMRQRRLFCAGTQVPPDICLRVQTRNWLLLIEHANTAIVFIQTKKNQDTGTYMIVKAHSQPCVFQEVECFPSLHTALNIKSSYPSIRKMTPLKHNLYPLRHRCSSQTHRTVNQRTSTATS